jgi:DNA replication ATP-dependent helicase Dna2
MNEDIMLLSNKLIYSDRLRCGSDEVAKRTLTIPNVHLVRDLITKEISCSGKEHWMERLLSEG